MPELDDFTVPLGKAKIVREGSDVTIVSFGIGMTYALRPPTKLAGRGSTAEVIDLRSLRPMDTATVVESVKKTNRCVTVEEGWPVCSIGADISAALMQEAFDWLDAPVMRVTGKDVPMPYAANLEKLALPSCRGEVGRGGQGRLLRRLEREREPCRCHQPILMPALSPTMEEPARSRNGWSRRATRSRSGDVIAEIETDKATMEVEAVDEGTVGKIVVPRAPRP